MLTPITRSLSQLDDPIFRGVLLRSIAWSFACYVAIHIGAIWVVHRVLALHGWLAWVADTLGSIGASLLALWLFLPLATAIGMMYFDRIATSVEHRFYPWLPPPNSASLLDQVWDGLAVAFKVLAFNVIALFLVFLLPGIGFLMGWMIAAYAIGRGLFVAVAMRRMPRVMAESLYRANRGAILAQGGILALATYIPILNLLIPIIGVAAMVHALDMALAASESPRWRLV